MTQQASVPGRISPDRANYKERATPEQLAVGEQCGGCVFFNYDILKRGPHTCEVVFGPIEFKGICDLWRPSIAREDPDEPMTHSTTKDEEFEALMLKLKRLKGRNGG